MIRITPDTPVHFINSVRCCVKCRHARRVDNPYKLEVVCTRFKTINLVTGVPTYYDAEGLRRDEQACGVAGKLFEPIVVNTEPPLEEKEKDADDPTSKRQEEQADEQKEERQEEDDETADTGTENGIESFYSATPSRRTDLGTTDENLQLSKTDCSADEGCSF